MTIGTAVLVLRAPLKSAKLAQVRITELHKERLKKKSSLSQKQQEKLVETAESLSQILLYYKHYYNEYCYYVDKMLGQLASVAANGSVIRKLLLKW